MALNKAYDQYRENAVYTATPEELTLMLYNGLIRFILQAQAALESKDLYKVSSSIVKAQDIVLYFQSTLDMRYDVSHNLLLIYDFMYRQLIDANIKKDNGILEGVLGMARELRDTWTQAMRLAKKQVASQRSPAGSQ